jgi:AcrR family transcriptional regulator
LLVDRQICCCKVLLVTTVRRTQKERREQAEAALLGAAAELVVEHGVRSLTLARVGERAGYSRGLVTHHFGSKQALLERLARASQVGFVPGLDGLPPGLDRLLRLIDGYIGALGDVGVLNRAFLLLWAEATTAPELAPIFRERDEAFRADLRDDVAAGIAEGAIRPDVVPDEVAITVVGQLRGVGLQRLLDPGAVDTERLRRSVTAHWRRALARSRPDPLTQ